MNKFPLLPLNSMDKSLEVVFAPISVVLCLAAWWLRLSSSFVGGVFVGTSKARAWLMGYPGDTRLGRSTGFG